MDHPESPGHAANDGDAAVLELVIRQGTLPDDVRGLRERVFRDETRFLADAEVASEDDKVGTHFVLYQDGSLAGAALGLKAEESSFPARTGVPSEQVKGMYFATRLMVAPNTAARGWRHC